MKHQHHPAWISPLATAGYAAKGIVYGIIGFFAATAAFGGGNEVAGSKDALRSISNSSWGSALLVIVGIGLLAYGIYRLLGAFADFESEGSDESGLAKRTGYVASGLAYSALAVFAFTGAASGSSGGDGKESLAARVLELPFGAILVGAAGLGIALAGIFQWVKAARGSYAAKFRLNRFASRQRHWIERAAKLGLSARGVVFLIIGFFVVKAAVQHDSSEVTGIEGALRTLAQQPYGPWLLGLTAVGLLCYGIYCEVLSAFGRWHGQEG